MILDITTATPYANTFATKYRITNKEVKEKLPHLFTFGAFVTTKEDKKIEVKNNTNLTEQFKKDLAFNKPIEQSLELAYHCHNYSNLATYEFNDNHKFDLKVTYTADNINKLFTYIELKNDRVAVKYGNLAIEHFSWGKDSGIKTTEANLWISRVDGFFIVFKTSRLIDAINDLKPRSVPGGDSLASMNYLLPIRDLVDYMSYIMVDDFNFLNN